jgi:hypothetical protein
MVLYDVLNRVPSLPNFYPLPDRSTDAIRYAVSIRIKPWETKK